MVTLSFEAGPGAHFAPHGLELPPCLGLGRVEGRVSVDEGKGGGGEGFEEGEVVGEVDLVGGHEEIVILEWRFVNC